MSKSCQVTSKYPMYLMISSPLSLIKHWRNVRTGSSICSRDPAMIMMGGKFQKRPLSLIPREADDNHGFKYNSHSGIEPSRPHPVYPDFSTVYTRSVQVFLHINEFGSLS